MSLIGRLRSRLSPDRRGGRAETPLAQAERLLRAGGAVGEIRRSAERAIARDDVETAWRALFGGDLDGALQASYAAADSRPYDVDSRIVHGTVRLARGELEHAEHEFDAVIEEFGAEADAADGRRATILARGFAPLDDIPAAESDWEAAAVLLTTLWRVAGVGEERLAGLAGAHEDGRAVILQAWTSGLAADSEAEDGLV